MFREDARDLVTFTAPFAEPGIRARLRGMAATGNSSAAAPAAGLPTSPALAKLKRGEWTLEEYLDDRVSRAVARLPPWVSGEHRETVRETLRFQLATDPALEQVLAALKRNRQTPAAG